MIDYFEDDSIKDLETDDDYKSKISKVKEENDSEKFDVETEKYIKTQVKVKTTEYEIKD